MAHVFELPDVGEGIAEGTIVEWLVAEGETVERDQPVVRVETDKAVVELPTPYAGVVLKLHAAPGDTIPVGAPLLTVGEAGEASGHPAEETGSGAAPAPPEPPPAADTPVSGPPRRPLATPRTRRLARELGVDLAAVRGTGPGGRITDEDVRRAAEVPAESAAGTVQVFAAGGGERGGAAAGPAVTGVLETTPDGPVERIPLTHLRKVIAQAMVRSVERHVHVTHVDEADVTELLALRERAKEPVAGWYGVRPTLLPFFVRAVVMALQRHPEFNATVDEERGELLLHRYHNIGIAVDTPEGLIVPVVRNAERKSIVELAREIGDLAARARERRLGLDELRGGTSTVTNIGPLGGLFATPIINGDELAIIGLHTIAERPVVRDGAIVVRKMMHLSVSFDHRWIDGAQAARFMTDLVAIVENPGLLMARL